MDQVAWCSGPSGSMYSWTGPGSAWMNQAEVLGSMKHHSMVCDKANNAIWVLTGSDDPYIFRYSLYSGSWRFMPQYFPHIQTYTQAVLCNNSRFIVTPGGQVSGLGSDTVLLTQISNSYSINSSTTLLAPVFGHVVTCISPTS